MPCYVVRLCFFVPLYTLDLTSSCSASSVSWFHVRSSVRVFVCVRVSVLRMYLVRNWYFCRFFGFSIVIYRTDDDDYDSTNDEGRIIFSDILRVCFRSIISTAFVNHRRYCCCCSMAPLLALTPLAHYSQCIIQRQQQQQSSTHKFVCSYRFLCVRMAFFPFSFFFFSFTALLRFGSVSFFFFIYYFANFKVCTVFHTQYH